MKVVVAHGPGNNVKELRKLLHGAGAQCAAEDCVIWDDLASRLGQSECDLVVVQAAEAVDWSSIDEARSFTEAPLIAIGPNGAVEAAARQAGISEYLIDDRMHQGLNDVVLRMMGEGEIRCQRGKVFSVVAPTAGNGGTFVSLNLAAQLAKQVKDKAKGAFIDMGCGLSKVALVLHHELESTIEDTSTRLHRLDRTSLLGMFHEDESGLELLYGPPDHPSDNFLTGEVVRRLAVLSRMAAASTVLRIGSTIRQPQIDAMRLSDKVVVVVRPDVPSLNRAATTMDNLNGYGIPTERIVVAINFWGEAGLASKAHIEETLHWKGPHYLTYDPGRVNRCINEGILLQKRYPRCRLAKELGKLGKLLMA